MIKLTGINKIYRTNEIETVALENVNLEVNKGEFLSIMGPSGCGKSTLLNIMGLLDAPTSGTIEIAGTKVDGMKDKELAAFRNQKLGFVFQSFHLINSLNVIDNVERLEYKAQGLVTESSQFLVLHAFYRRAVYFNLSTAGSVQQPHNIQQGRLAATGRTHNADKLPFSHIQIYIFQR